MSEYRILVPPPRRRLMPLLVVGGTVVLAVAAVGFVVSRHYHASATTDAVHRAVKGAANSPGPFRVVSTTPSAGSSDVATEQVVSVRFSRPLDLGQGGRRDHGRTTVPQRDMPTFEPAVAGAWAQAGPSTLTFHATAPFVPSEVETVTIPAGSRGPRATDGVTLVAPISVSFTVAKGTYERLQQLLALLDYLPLSFTPSGGSRAPADLFSPQTGAFAWRWPGTPPSLSSLWTEGSSNVITTAAVMNFENQNGLTVDGLAGQRVWTTLGTDLTTGRVNADPYDYVYVSKVLPENLTVYKDGAPVLTNIPVNTGAPGADTTDGTYPVFEHVTSSRMVGTNPNGTHYNDPHVPWASFFNGGDALHGFVRASYGFPQSNGCVEMPIADAAQVWPLTPIGTLVTIVGPTS